MLSFLSCTALLKRPSLHGWRQWRRSRATSPDRKRQLGSKKPLLVETLRMISDICGHVGCRGSSDSRAMAREGT